MLQFASELESKEDMGEKERAESLLSPEKMEQPLTLAFNPWAEGGTDQALQGGLV